MAATFSTNDLVRVLKMLSNAITGQDAAMTNRVLSEYQANPYFNQMLAKIMVSVNPRDLVSSPHDCEMLLSSSSPTQLPPRILWRNLRILSAVTLKNNIKKIRSNLDNTTLIAAAASSTQVLLACSEDDSKAIVQEGEERVLEAIQDFSNIALIKAASQIVVGITKIAGSLEWWAQDSANNGCGFGDLGVFIYSKLLAGTESLKQKPTDTSSTLEKAISISRIQGGLYVLEYFLEDASHLIAKETGSIIQQLGYICVCADQGTEISVPQGIQTPADILQQSFRFLLSIYERGQELDWNWENLSDTQKGLCEGALRFAETSTNMCSAHGLKSMTQNSGTEKLPPLLMRDVFFSFTTLLDYIEYFYEQGEEKELFVNWVQVAVHVLQMANPSDSMRNTVDPEITASVCNFIIKACEASLAEHDATPIDCVTDIIATRVVDIASLLFPLVVMTPTEEYYALENDHCSKRDVHSRFSTMRRTYGTQDGAQEGDEDEEKTLTSLRAAASTCIETLNRFDSSKVFPIVFQHIQQVLNPTQGITSDWRKVEAVVYVLGKLVIGTYEELVPHLPLFVPLLIQILESNGAISDAANPALLVAASAAGTLTSLTPWILTYEDVSLFERYLKTVLTILLSTQSKKVQLGLLQCLFGTIAVVYRLPYLMVSFTAYLSNIIECICTLIQACHSTNLAYVCDIIIMLVNNQRIDTSGQLNDATGEGIQSGEATGSFANLVVTPTLLRQLNASLEAAFPVRMERLASTVNAYYSHSGHAGSASQTVLVEKDVFDVARALYNVRFMLIDATPSDTNPESMLREMIKDEVEKWLGLMHGLCLQACAREAQGFDDTALISNPLNLCSLLLSRCCTGFIASPEVLNTPNVRPEEFAPHIRRLLQISILTARIITRSCEITESDDAMFSPGNTGTVCAALQLVCDVLKIIPETAAAGFLTSSCDSDLFGGISNSCNPDYAPLFSQQLVILLHGIASYWEGLDSNIKKDVNLYTVCVVVDMLATVCTSAVSAIEKICTGTAHGTLVLDQPLIENLKKQFVLLEFVCAHYAKLCESVIRVDGIGETLQLNSKIAFSVVTAVSRIAVAYKEVAALAERPGECHDLFKSIVQQLESIAHPARGVLCTSLIVKTLFFIKPLTIGVEKAQITANICACIQLYFSNPVSARDESGSRDIGNAFLKMLYSWQRSAASMGVRDVLSETIDMMIKASSFIKQQIIGELQVLNVNFSRDIINDYAVNLQ